MQQEMCVRMICIAASSRSPMHHQCWLPLWVAIHLIMYCMDI